MKQKSIYIYIYQNDIVPTFKEKFQDYYIFYDDYWIKWHVFEPFLFKKIFCKTDVLWRCTILACILDLDL